MLQSKSKLAAPLLFMAVVSACAPSREIGGDPVLSVMPAGELPAPTATDVVNPNDLYSLGPYDKLTIEVYGIPELVARNIQVDANGAISFPMAGSLNVGGMTPAQVEQAIAARLTQAYIRNPVVTVNLLESVSHAVTIDGQVRKPGQYPVAGGMTLLRSVSLAEGVTENARLNDVVVFRTVGGQRYAALYNLAAIRRGRYQDPEIYANDIIMVGDSASRRLFRDLVAAVPAVLTPIVILLSR
jgi:polysaccharide export outer membrane protein